MFGAAFSRGDPDEDSMHHKTYEEILEEYEKFFSMDHDMKKTTDHRIKGANVFEHINITFAESIEGI